MDNIQFDSGIRQYRVNGNGVLRFHPGDPNLYARFLEATEKIQELANNLTAQAEQRKGGPADMMQLLSDADRQVKMLLNWVFGNGNDFDRILQGVNLLAVAENGQQILTNLLAALEPILTEGAEQFAKQQVREAAERAESRRNAT